MNRLSFILGSIGALYGGHQVHWFLVGRRVWQIVFLVVTMLATGPMAYGQSPAEWWSAADSSQKAFARQCVEYGNTLGRLTSWTDQPGETLAGIAWMEVSFIKDLKHDEDSSGPFGLSDFIRKAYNGQISNGIILDGYSEKFEEDARIALALFEDNYRDFRRLGYSRRESWFWCYPEYCSGKNWRRFKQRGIVFSERVRFLRTQFKE